MNGRGFLCRHPTRTGNETRCHEVFRSFPPPPTPPPPTHLSPIGDIAFACDFMATATTTTPLMSPFFYYFFSRALWLRFLFLPNPDACCDTSLFFFLDARLQGPNPTLLTPCLRQKKKNNPPPLPSCRSQCFLSKISPSRWEQSPAGFPP